MKIQHILRLIEEKGVEAVEGREVEIKAFSRVDDDFKRRLRRAVVCLANSNGGCILLGINETSNEVEGCPGIDAMELSNIVYEGTKPGILVEFREHTTPEGRVVFYGRVPRSPRIHATSDGARYHRVGKKCMPLYPDEEYKLLVERGTLDVTNQPVQRITADAIDGELLESVARKWAERQAVLGITSPPWNGAPLDVLGPLGALTETKTGERALSAAGAILLAGEHQMSAVIPGRKILYVLMEGDTEYRERREWAGPAVSAVDEVMEVIKGNTKVATLRVGLVQREIPDFPPDAVREILINAVAHRDYLINASIIVRQYKDRIEVTSPGAFIGGITPDNILHHNPTHRNPGLVRIMHRLGLVEEIGIGIDRVYESLLRAGKEPPMFESKDEQVTCIIPNGSLDAAFLRFIEELSDDGKGMSLDELIVIHHVKRHSSIERATAARIIQRSDVVATSVLSDLVGRNVLKRYGTRGGSYFALSDDAARKLGIEMRELRHPVIDDLRSLSLIVEAARSMGGITNRDVRELLGVGRYRALGYLNALVERGELRKVGSRRWTRYLPL